MLISDLCSSHAHNLAAADRQYTPFLEIFVLSNSHPESFEKKWGHINTVPIAKVFVWLCQAKYN
jgi:hypothetical protein